jgi:hypothetical protein
MPPVAARDRAAAPRPRATLAAVGGTAITRRRALGLGAAAGLGTLLGPLRSVPALARPGRPNGFGLTVTPADFAGSRTSRVLRAPRRFDLLGLRGSGHVEVRVRARGGAWSPWVPLAVHGDHAPDTGTGERASDPVWTGGSDELQLRAARAPRHALRVHFVAVPAAVRRRARRGSARARARAAQAGGVQPGAPPPIIPRAAWGADALPPRSAPRFGALQAAFVHHTATANAYGPQDSAAIVFGIHKFHRDTNGWNDIGYNFLVDRYGQVFEGRAGGVDQAVIGAHAQGYNSYSTGVAVLGTHSAEPVTEPALAVLSQLLGWKLSLHGVPTEGTVVVPSGGGSSNRFPAGTPVTLNRISGHRDGDSTSCPGDALYAQLPEVRRRATALAGPVAGGQVTLAVAAPNVPYGQPAAFAGIVTRPGGVAAAGEPVALQKRTSRGTWVTVARATAALDGTWATDVPWRRSGQVRARAAGTSSKVASVAVVPTINLRTPRSRRVRAGGLLRLSGRVRPAQPVRVLVEFRGGDGRWRRVRLVAGRVRGTNFAATIRMRRPGLYRLTPRTAGPRDRATGAPLLVRVVRGRR